MSKTSVFLFVLFIAAAVIGLWLLFVTPQPVFGTGIDNVIGAASLVVAAGLLFGTVRSGNRAR